MAHLRTLSREIAARLLDVRFSTPPVPNDDFSRESTNLHPLATRPGEKCGLEKLEFGWPIGMLLCRALGGGLFELRVSLRSRRIARVMGCLHDGELFAVHGFIKKTQRTPESDLRLARSRKRQLEKAK